MFSGTYQNSIDPKGRVIVPAKFRDGLGHDFVLTKGQDGCLYLYPRDEWTKFRDKLETIPLSSKAGRAFKRFFFANAVESEMDKQGRLGIPQNLREYAMIEKELVTIGVDERIEIWAKQVWEDYNASQELDGENIERAMEGLGI